MWALILKYIEPILSWTILLLVAGWVIYAGMIKPVINPTPTTTQTGGVSYNVDIKEYPCGRLFSIDQGIGPKVSSAMKPVADKIKAVAK